MVCKMFGFHGCCTTMCESCSLNFPIQVVLFMNSILLLNNLNQLVVIAYGARTCGFVFNSESSSSEPSGSRNKRQQASFPSRIFKQLERFLQKESVVPEEVNFNEFSLLSGALSMSLCCILTFTTPKYRYEIFRIWIWLCIHYIKAFLHPRLEDFLWHNADIQRTFKAGPSHPQPRVILHIICLFRLWEYKAFVGSKFYSAHWATSSGWLLFITSVKGKIIWVSIFWIIFCIVFFWYFTSYGNLLFYLTVLIML